MIEQDPLGAREPAVRQVLLLEREKSAGVPTEGSTVTEEIVKVWLPVFVSVTVCGEEAVPTLTLPNAKDGGLKEAAG